MFTAVQNVQNPQVEDVYRSHAYDAPNDNDSGDGQDVSEHSDEQRENALHHDSDHHAGSHSEGEQSEEENENSFDEDYDDPYGAESDELNDSVGDPDFLLKSHGHKDNDDEHEDEEEDDEEYYEEPGM